MGFASSRACYATASEAAADSCAGLVFGYSGGAAACVGSAVTGTEATFTIRYAPHDGLPFTASLVQPLPACDPLTLQDGIDIGWGILAAVIGTGAILFLTRAVR